MPLPLLYEYENDDDAFKNSHFIDLVNQLFLCIIFVITYAITSKVTWSKSKYEFYRDINDILFSSFVMINKLLTFHDYYYVTLFLYISVGVNQNYFCFWYTRTI